MAYYPCSNKACKSFGKPHPNCRCLSPMASGGEVSFCSADRNHDEGCEYSADGGEVGILGHLDPSHVVAGHFFNGGILGVLKMDSEQDLDKYHRSVAKGHKSLNAEIDRMLADGKHEPAEDRSKNHKSIDEWIEKGGISHNLHEERYHQNAGPQMMAEGGEAKKPHEGLHSHPVEKVYPDQNIMLQGARGRISNYLSSIRPQQHLPKLAFDNEPDQSVQKKAYAMALRIADHPMSIMRDVTKGTIDPEHLRHFNAMYPEASDVLQKKITEKIIHAQLSGKKPNRKIRQGLSLLMGTPLSGDLTPQGIQAAQSTFVGKKQEPQPGQAGPPNKAKKNTAPLSKSDNSFLTGNQSLVARQQKRS